LKKSFITLVILLVSLLLTVGIAFGNAFTLQAENGRILAPAGLGVELSGAYLSGENPSPLYETQISYGIASTVTLAGQFSCDFKNGYNGQKEIKALFSPTRRGSSYTLYANYDLNQSQLARYGISVWSDSRFIYAFVNLESRNATPDQASGLLITPGLNFKLGRISLNGEAEYKIADWSGQELRVGANYKLNPKITTKFIFQTDLNNNPERTYQAGVSVQL
jgi:hypothetical protein